MKWKKIGTGHNFFYYESELGSLIDYCNSDFEGDGWFFWAKDMVGPPTLGPFPSLRIAKAAIAHHYKLPIVQKKKNKRCGKCADFGKTETGVLGYTRCAKLGHPVHFNTNACENYRDAEIEITDRYEKMLEDCRTGRRLFWVCFDLDNGKYIWWYPTREEARERYKRHQRNPNWAQLSPPVKVEVKPKKRIPHWLKRKR